MSKAAFLDRDGVINRKARKGEYITRGEQVEFLPGVAEAIALLRGAGFLVVVVTNQRCVAKGLLTIEELEDIHQRMRDELKSADAVIDAIYYCPHEYHDRCKCRKPAPGMLLDAAREHSIDLAVSWMIGDSEIDVTAGKNAGCKTARILMSGEIDDPSDVVAANLLDAVHQILRREESSAGTRTMDATPA